MKYVVQPEFDNESSCIVPAGGAPKTIAGYPLPWRYDTGPVDGFPAIVAADGRAVLTCADDDGFCRDYAAAFMAGDSAKMERAGREAEAVISYVSRALAAYSGE